MAEHQPLSAQAEPLESVGFALRNRPEFSREEYADVLAEHESLLYKRRGHAGSLAKRRRERREHEK